MTFTFWLFQPYIYRRIYNAYMQPCISLNLCEFSTIFWHLKYTVNCVLWISMRVHIFHAIFIYISITKCPLALYIQSVYAHSHSHTRYYTILCGLISIFNYIFHMRATSPQQNRSETFFGLSDNRQQNQLKRKTTTKTSQKERGATVYCVCVRVCFLLLFTLTSY